MRKVSYCFLFVLLFSNIYAQRSKDIQWNPSNGMNFVEFLEVWEPGIPVSEDDNFFISRVKLKERFENKNTQVHPELTTARQLCWWTPMGDGKKEWKSFPRNQFEADNFNMWQYVDIHGNWGDGWFRVPGVFNDVAHKNGVRTGCVLFINWAEPVKKAGDRVYDLFSKLMTKDEYGRFKYAEKLIRFLRYYGIDGIGVNPEGEWDTDVASEVQDFFVELHVQAEKLGLQGFHIDWYDSNDSRGHLSFGQNALQERNRNWFQKGNRRVTDMFMLNYNIDVWGGNNDPMGESARNAVKFGRSSYDVYAGFYLRGRGLSSYDSEPRAGKGWEVLKDKPVSVCLWGEHDRNNIHNASYEHGKEPLVVQQTYLRKLEYFFTSGTRNPVNAPVVTNTITTVNEEDMRRFHGISTFFPARSTMQELPFVTRFNLGNGLFFNREGKTENGYPWYNVGVQDWMPSWRWWVTGHDGRVPADAIQCDFVFEDAWFGGSCLKLHGRTTYSKVRLFKTNIPVHEKVKLSFTYKMKMGEYGKLKLVLSKVGAEDQFIEIPVEGKNISREWQTVTCKLGNFGWNENDHVACIGLVVENTSDDFEMFIGELALTDARMKFKPVKPEITKAEIIRTYADSLDFKLVWNVIPWVNREKDMPVMNEAIDTWYFEVYLKDSSKARPRLITTTTSWAAYACGVNVKAMSEVLWLGVRAVAPDGKRSFKIVWQEVKR
ncbi:MULTISPECIES: endo-beta-N-acetylglucosaminidase [Butyricimonas]|uniref:endo-beta-N-acetylglucosaminidase n=1 Tax=Butyricimonas TaxID=574697 RepID=UPI000B38A73B|nr:MULTISPECIES: hypothetical protein [Butyricimonas]OUN63461.1 hypothetical protein B5G13_17950 [Butyricimonas sp. An62]